MRARLRPLAVATVIAAMFSLAVFFVATMTVGDLSTSGTHAIAAGPMVLVEIVRVHTIEGGSVTARPGWGLLAVWVGLLGYALAIARHRETRLQPA